MVREEGLPPVYCFGVPESKLLDLKTWGSAFKFTEKECKVVREEPFVKIENDKVIRSDVIIKYAPDQYAPDQAHVVPIQDFPQDELPSLDNAPIKICGYNFRHISNLIFPQDDGRASSLWLARHNPQLINQPWSSCPLHLLKLALQTRKLAPKALCTGCMCLGLLLQLSNLRLL